MVTVFALHFVFNKTFFRSAVVDTVFDIFLALMRRIKPVSVNRKIHVHLKWKTCLAWFSFAPVINFKVEVTVTSSCIFFIFLSIFVFHDTPCLPSPGELVTTPIFDGEESYIAYPPLTNIHDDLRVELEFKPLERDGLMFFCGGKKMKVEDFVAISMVDGRVEFRYELGTGNRWAWEFQWSSVNNRFHSADC